MIAIHSRAIKTLTNSRLLNGVLGVKPPPIADEELKLLRETSVILAQLSFGDCNKLNSYLSKIEPDI